MIKAENIPFDYAEIIEDVAMQKGYATDIDNIGSHKEDQIELLINAW